jgi:hypothetical protein
VSNGSGRSIDTGSHERCDGQDAEYAKYRASAPVGPVPPAQRFATAGAVLFRDLFDARRVNGARHLRTGLLIPEQGLEQASPRLANSPTVAARACAHRRAARVARQRDRRPEGPPRIGNADRRE